jgi:hypothetical protein
VAPLKQTMSKRLVPDPNPLAVLLMGPTGSGKTDLAVELVRRLPCDIVSVDSAMVYRGMDIGTAKPGPQVLAVAPHRLIDILEPFADKWRAFGWDVVEADGHDLAALVDAFHRARWVMPRGRPIVVIAHTVKGRGVEMAEFNYKWHTHAPDPPTADAMLRELARNYGREERGYSRLGEPEVKEDFYGGE